MIHVDERPGGHTFHVPTRASPHHPLSHGGVTGLAQAGRQLVTMYPTLAHLRAGLLILRPICWPIWTPTEPPVSSQVGLCLHADSSRIADGSAGQRIRHSAEFDHEQDGLAESFGQVMG